ncbi:MAG TPA: formate dehydrogenase-N subunit alpha [Candidatus Aquilonibacter sp.]|nr:formate dehydrogenase-N subunit alpha [Candidatus Aquilonibacter sp.]
MPGLGTSFGRGGATVWVPDLVNADCILIEGSNFAEAHPVAYRFVMQAKERGATIIHVDPRFTRTSATADIYAPIRSGTDIAFLGGIINYVLSNDRYFKEYVVAYTNAANIVNEGFKDTDDLDGLFSGYDAQGRTYDTTSWGYEKDENGHIKRDPSLQHPRCVINVLRKHYARYTPEMVERVCGTSQAQFLQIAELLAKNSGREKTTAFAYAVGWTQHTAGVQFIRTAAILQLLLGNIGRPGGGIMALRGHADIQGATDIATLYDLLPGYLPMPSAWRPEQTLAEYLKNTTKPTGWWANTPKYVVSLLKAWYGEHATAQNDYCFDYLPQLIGDHSMLPMVFAMKDGALKGYFAIGQNPGASGQNAELVKAAMEELEWFVNIDSYDNETVSFWRREGADPSKIKTEVFFLPAATVLEKEGTMTQTSRLLQWHDKAVEPAGESKSDAWYFNWFAKRMKELYKDSTDPKDRPIQQMTWEYEHDDPHERAKGEPSVLKVLQEINGYRVADNEQVALFTELKDDGSTACGGWIYSGVCPDKQTNKARNRDASGPYTALNWGFAWPANRRTLYNRASADPQGKPWSERKKYVWWDDEKHEWTGFDVPDFIKTKAPDTVADPNGKGMDAHSGADPFIMMLDGRGQLFVASGLKDGPMPAHYEPLQSVVSNELYAQQSNPTLGEYHRRDNPYNKAIDEAYPYVLTTYRITEQSGIMTRYVPWLAELQPTAFCEIDPELAVEKGIKSGDWVTISTSVGEMEARALVSGRMVPLRIGAKGARKKVHQIGIPYNFGDQVALARGDSVGNLIPIALDPNVSIHESKTLTCTIRPGRRRPHHRDRIDEPVPQSQRDPSGQPIGDWAGAHHGRGYQQQQGEDQGKSEV